MRDGDDYVINGTKMFITNGTWADVVLLFARTNDAPGHKGVSAFLVPTDTPGLTRRAIHGKLGLRGQATAELVLDGRPGARRRAARPRGQGLLRRHVRAGQGPDVGRGRLRRHRPGRAGRGRRLRGRARAVRQAHRHAPARPGADQRHRGRRRRRPAADLAGRRPRSTAGEPFATEASKAKLFASEAAVRAANNALQVFGGYGYIDEYPVGKLLRDARVMTLYEGTSQIQKLLIGRALTGVSAF